MLVKKAEDIKSSEITDEHLVLNRRNFMRGAILTATTLGTGWLYRSLTSSSKEPLQTTQTIENVESPASGTATLLPNDKVNSFQDITNYNNYYEFSTDKEAVAYVAKDFVSRPWTVTVEGLC